MDFLKKIVVLCVVVGALSQGEFDPYSAGPHSLVRVRLNSTVYAPGLPVHMSAWAPADEGVYPVVYFFSGFQATTPVEIYSGVLEHVASHGYIVSAPWNLTTNVYPEEKIDEIQQVFDWAREYLDGILSEAGATDVVGDYDTAFAFTHSSGAHLVCSYLQLGGCGDLKGMALTSPVDGVDPFGVVLDFCTTPGLTLNFSLPTLVAAAGLDAVPGREALNVSCAPDELSNRRFYEAIPPHTPRWFLNATEFGHMDYTDRLAENFNEFVDFCAWNEEGTALDFRNYRNFIAGTTVSFFFSLLEADCQSYLPYLYNTTIMPVGTWGEQGDDWGEGCPLAYCTPTNVTIVPPSD